MYVFPDLGVTATSAETILTTDDVEHKPVQMPEGLGEGREEFITFVKQALTIILHGSNSNTNPFHSGPNVYHIRVQDDGVLAWADSNWGPEA